MSRAQDDLEVFAGLVGRKLTSWQAEALRLETRQTALVAARQLGKSYSLSVLACWWAFRQPAQTVLIVSAGEIAAGRLLRDVQRIAGHRLLAGSVVDETQSRVILSNGSEIRSLPASDKQVRGWSADLAICDEAAFVPDDLIEGAFIPTVMARPHGRLVFACTPWATGGAFHRIVMAGLGGSKVTRTFTWSMDQAAWITPETIESLRETLSPLRFRAEVLGEWIAAGDGFFNPDDLVACTAPYPKIRDGRGAPAVIGLDWGRQRDRHAVAVVGVLNDYGVNGRPVAAVPWCEISKREYVAQFEEIADLASRWDAVIWSETNGPGGPATELLARQVTRSPVKGVYSGQRDKEQAYQRLNMMLERRDIVLPEDPELLRELGGVQAEATSGGGVRIAARTESVHDDLPDALTLALSKLPAQLASVPAADVPPGTGWCQTPAGVRVPVPFVTLRAEEAWDAVNGPLWYCPACRAPVPGYKETCTQPGCQGTNPGTVTDPPWGRDTAAAPVPAAADGEESVPVANWYCPSMRRCTRAGHIFDGRAHGTSCPQCGGGGSRQPYGSVALPAAFQSALSMIPRR